MVRRWIMDKQIGMIFKDARTVSAQQPFAKLVRIPTQLEAHHVIGEVDCRLSRNLGPDRLRDPRSFLAKLFSRPITLHKSTISQEGGGVVRIYVSVGALKKEAQGCGTKCVFHRAGHPTDVIRGILEIVGSEYYRMARVIHQDGDRCALKVVDANDQYRGVNWPGRLLFWVCPEHRNFTVRMHLPSVVSDVDLTASGPNLRVGKMLACFRDGSCDLFDGSGLPGRQAVAGILV